MKKIPQLYTKNSKGRYQEYKIPDIDISKTFYRKINENIEGAEFGDKGYLSGECCAWVKDIVPINLVTAILEKNGWDKSTGWSYVGSGKRGYQFSKELDDKWVELDRMTYGDLQICQCENLRDWSYINECNHYFHFEFTYVHELQHLLYALHIDSNLKI